MIVIVWNCQLNEKNFIEQINYIHLAFSKGCMPLCFLSPTSAGTMVMYIFEICKKAIANSILSLILEKLIFLI
jgi:hypothetical protein